MNLRELEASFRTDSDDAVKPYLWSSDEVIGWLNEAVDEACNRAKLIFEKTDPGICQITISADDGSVYPIHESIVSITYASITDSSGVVTELGLTDRYELDRIRPDWRTDSRQPAAIIVDDTSIECDCVVDGDYTINLEVFRTPLCPMAKEDDKPEIGKAHHKYLVQWALHRAYEKPDAETLNQGKSEAALKRFEDYFGQRPDANMRRDENANRPHRNKAYW